MGADARYLVGIDFDVSDLSSKLSGLSSRVPSDLFGNATKNFRSEIGNIGSAVSDIGGKLAGAFTGAVEKVADIGMTLGKIGVVAGVGAMAYGVAGLNSNLEKTKIALADILTSNKVTSNLTEGLDMASGLMAKIRKDAAALPGETSDLAQIFKLAAIPGLRAGASTSRIENLSAVAMAYGMGTVGLDGGTTARELSMLIGGRAGAHNTLGLQLAGLSGGAAKQFNELSDAKRFEFLEKEFAKHAGSIALYANSFEGIASTLRDNGKLVLATATAPLFENAKRTLGEMNDWFDSHKGTVLAWSSYIGERLSDAFESAKSHMLTWWPAIESFAEHAYARIAELWERVAPYVERFGAKVQAAIADPATLDRIEEVLKLYGAVKLGGMAMPFASPLASALGSAGGADSLAGIAGAAAPAALALGTLAVVTKGAYDALNDGTYLFHDAAFSFWSHTKENLKTAGQNLKTAGTTIEDNLSAPLRTAGENAGTLVLGASTVWSYAMVEATHHLDFFASFLGPAAQNLANFALMDWGGAGVDAGNPRHHIRDRDVHLKTFQGGMDTLSDATRGGPKLPSNMTVNQTIYVNNTISGSQEPSRVARVITRQLAELSRFPTSSQYAGTNYLAGRRR